MAVSLKDAVDCYMQDTGQSSPGAASLRQSVLNRLARRFPGCDFKDISTRDLTHFLYGTDGVSAGKSASTVASYRSCLKGFFAYGFRMGWSDTPVVVFRPPGTSEKLLKLMMGLH
ncbi:hypothetical protein [Streptomyces sp. NPDC001774]